MARRIKFVCDYCGGPGSDRASEYFKKKRHFCKRQCYSNYRRERLPREEQNAWQGGVTPEESQRRYREANKAKIAAIARNRYKREMDAPGSHTKAQWQAIRSKNDCAMKDDTCGGPHLKTKDHITPLVMGGSDNIDNLQVLCSSHNSRKSRRVQLELLREK